MSVRAARLWLWLGLVLMAPLPVSAAVATGLMPAARLLMLGGVCLLVMVLEHAKGAVGLLALLFFVQAAFYLLALFVVAHVVARLLGRLAPRAVALGTALLLLAGVVLTTSTAWYRTPLRAAAVEATLLEVFE